MYTLDRIKELITDEKELQRFLDNSRPNERGEYDESDLLRYASQTNNKKIQDQVARNIASNSTKLGVETGLNLARLGKSINDQTQSRTREAELMGRIPNFQTLRANPLLNQRLYQAQQDTTRGLDPIVRDAANIRNLQAFNNQIRNNYALAGGQSGVSAGLNQAAALDRAMANNQLAVADQQAMAQNKRVFDDLISQQRQQDMFQAQQNQARFQTRDLPIWMGQMTANNAQRLAAQQNEQNALEQFKYLAPSVVQATTRTNPYLNAYRQRTAPIKPLPVYNGVPQDYIESKTFYG